MEAQWMDVVVLAALAVPLLACLSGAQVQAAVPDLREQVSLNGQWPEGGEVPDYAGERFDERTYSREVTVPAGWTGRQIRLEFRQVNFVADVYVNGERVANHVGGWIPFAVDLTPHVTPGQTFSLRVVVKGSTDAQYVDSEGMAIWPTGTYRHDGSDSGIVDDVWLRAYGSVAIEDAFIKTSYRDRLLTVDYTVANHDSSAHTVKVSGEVTPATGGDVVRALETDEVALAPGESRTMTAVASWPDAELWMPDSPFLYHLASTVVEGETVLDRETRRFGFRELWIHGNQFVLNGIRINLWGDSIVRDRRRRPYLNPEAWPAHVDMMMHELNMRIIRWHQHPAADFLLDVADEKGLLMIDESALYARSIYTLDHDLLLSNMREWIGHWLRAHRNHPSIVIWSAENECGWMHPGLMRHVPLTDTELLMLGNAIRLHDPTRPVTYEGDGDVGDVMVDWHYPESYEGLPRRESRRTTSVPVVQSIYDWGRGALDQSPRHAPGWQEGTNYVPYMYPDKPTGMGEFLAAPWVQEIRPDVFWWQGTCSRGLRYTNYTNIRPFLMSWAWTDEEPGAKRNLINSFAPVALFDKDYDDLGTAPLMKGELPEVEEGAVLDRTLVLYNDEYRDTAVTVEVEVRSGGAIYASGRKTIELALGEHVDVPCSFQVPFVGAAQMEMVLRTYKGGVRKFEEARPFAVKAAGRTGRSADVVTFGDARPAVP
jgi:hypothetical protein